MWDFVFLAEENSVSTKRIFHGVGSSRSENFQEKILKRKNLLGLQ